MLNDDIRASIDLNLSGLSFDAMKQAETLLRKDGELRMKKKLSISMAIALALVLVTAAAVAAVLLGGKDVVDRLITPRALKTQSEEFSRAEIDEILKEAKAQGVELSPQFAQMLYKVENYYKSELAMLFAKTELGMYPSTWDVADQYWYGEFRMKLGEIYVNYATVPKEGELSQAEMLAKVAEYVREHTGQDYPLEDKDRYERNLSFTDVKLNPYQSRREWGVSYEAYSGRDPSFSLRLNPQGGLLRYEDNKAQAELFDSLPASQKLDAIVFEYIRRFGGPYQSLDDVPQEKLRELREKIRPLEAELGPADNNYAFLIQQEFGPAPEGSISQEQAVQTAIEAAHKQFKVSKEALTDGPEGYWSALPYVSSILLKAEGDYYYKVSFGKDYIVEVNARTGQAETVDALSPGNNRQRRSILDELLPEEERAFATKVPEMPTWAPDLPSTPYPQPSDPELPQLYWETLQAFNYKAETAQKIWDEAQRDYGEDRRFWPQALQALDDYRFNRPDKPGMAIVGIPLEGDITKEQAIEAARQALSGDSNSLYKPEYLAETKPAATYYYNMPEQGRRAWVVALVNVSGNTPFDAAMATVDAQTGEVLPEGQTQEEHQETFEIPRAQTREDGKPLIWGHKAIPAYYWEMMDKRGDTYESVYKLIQEEYERTQQMQIGWSMEASALYDLWMIDHGEEGQGEFYLSGLPAPEDIQLDKALEIAREAFLKDAGDKYAPEVLERVKAVYGFSFNVFGPGTRNYHVEFLDPEQPGYVTIGMVDLDAVTGEILVIHSDTGNG